WSVRSGNVVHRVEQSLFPNWIGTRQARKVRLAGRRLELSTVPFEVDGDRQTAHLVWEREALR
ncbi:MAG TPA: lipocalin-like domain-containing protein, partial [Elusimicrobiota bacterium]|nr:lipocalin-like domain-containing protein [Elusimicrobiota bacterium]